MKPTCFFRNAALLMFASGALTAQVAPRDAVPLKNWSTPQRWVPNPAERAAMGKGAAQLQFSSNQLPGTDALTFIAITPCRLVDTRGTGGGFVGVTPFNGPSIPSGGTATFPVLASSQTSTTEPAACGAIPDGAEAYSLNLTVVPHSGGAVDYVTMWQAGGTKPFVATLNDPQGAIAANAAIVPAGSFANNGGISVFNDGPAATDVIIDMNGYFAAPSDDNYNTAVGYQSLYSSTTGYSNTATGYYALHSNTTGNNNIAIGNNAAGGVSGGNSNNIHIGNTGAFTDNNVIWLGTQGTQTVTKIAGIYGQSIGTPNYQVCIDATARLGAGSSCSGTPSSRRFKEQIRDMGDASSGLLDLRPVTFLYKPEYDDGSHALQYGLIAEEVAEIFPEMVGYGDDGQPNSVKYQQLTPMLLNEVQKQNAALKSQLQLQREENRKLEQRLAAVEALLSGQTPSGQTPARPSGSQ